MFSMMEGEIDFREFNTEFPSVLNFKGVRSIGRLRQISEYGDEYNGNSVRLLYITSIVLQRSLPGSSDCWIHPLSRY